MKHIHILIVLLIAILLGILYAALGFGQTPLVPLGQVRPNVYGPGVHSDATGQPFTYIPQTSNRQKVQPHTYGPHIGMDQTGRPVVSQKVR